MRHPPWLRSRCKRLLAAAAAVGVSTIGNRWWVIPFGTFLVLTAHAPPALAMFSGTRSVTSNTFSTDTMRAPASLNAVLSGGTIVLTWNVTSTTYATGYRIMRSTTSGGPYTQVALRTPRTATTATDASVSSGLTYYYVLQSYFQNWTSVNSNQASATTPSSIVNGGFETGTFGGWTASGAATAVTTTGPHSGTYAAKLGSTSPTNGDSSITQTFTAGSSGTLSFWYSIACPDTVTYDWATATLRDNTAASTATVLARTCTTGVGWQQAIAPVTASHSYTLTLISHDDNYAGDPTYTTYDDVQAP